MGYYDMNKEERRKFVHKMEYELIADLKNDEMDKTLYYSADDDVYIRKNVSNILGKIYRGQKLNTQKISSQDQKVFKEKIIHTTSVLLKNDDENVRQTAVYLAGEIGKKDAPAVFDFLETALKDPHHKVRNGVMSSLKVMGDKNPQPTLEFAKVFIHDKDPEIRRKVVHGIELRGRTHPEDILPLLEELQYEDNPQVRKMIIHVLGQISYKEGCLEKVTSALKKWENKKIVEDIIPYIIKVHENYPFSAKTPEEARKYLKENI
ncbi:MAG: HEAT repeat domain-containing protein [Methanobacteriaceae archaeon]|nr:HEAT repeat domain-containing protein [Methanobacteriaceae archaeon]